MKRHSTLPTAHPNTVCPIETSVVLTRLQDTPPARAGTLKTIATLAGATLGAIAAINALIAARTPPLSQKLGGTFNRYPARQGDLAYTVKGSGSPVLLLHGLGAGNS